MELRILRGETENTNSKTIQNYEQRNLEENTEHRHHHPHRHRHHLRGDIVHGRVNRQKIAMSCEGRGDLLCIFVS